MSNNIFKPGASIALNHQESIVSLNYILVLLLMIVLIGAIEIPDWMILITNSPLPTLGREFPYWFPILAAIGIFNITLIHHIGFPKPSISLQTLSFFVFVVAMFLIELGHVLFGGVEFDGVLAFSLLWMFLFYSVLMLFNDVLNKARSWVVALSLLLIFLVCLSGVVITTFFSDGRGATSNWFDNNQLFDSTYMAYLALLGVLLVLFEWPFKLVGSLDLWVKVALLSFWIYVIRFHLLAGPELMLWAVLLYKISLITRVNFSRLVPVASILMFVGLLIAFNGLYQNPTFQGLYGGQYLFDEIGILHGDVISSFIRLETINQALRLFCEFPFFGVGMDAVTSIKVISLGLHSSFVYILVSSGLLGLFFFSCWIYLSVTTYWRARRADSLPLMVYLSGVSILIPTIFWWFGIIFYLFSTPKSGLLTMNDVFSMNWLTKNHDKSPE